jgi:uncharacterized membrane protein
MDVVNLLPPIPAWEGLHPLVVHFPVALLLVAPLLVLSGSLAKSSSRGLLLSAFVLMLLGTAATWVAVGSGHAEGERVERTAAPVVLGVLEQHEDLAETTRNVFTALVVLFGAILFVPGALGRPLGRLPSAAMHLAFLALYGGGLVFLVNTAHQGGRLVHDMGVRAAMSPAQVKGGLTLGAFAGETEAEEATETRGRLIGRAAAPGEAESRGEVSTDRGTPVTLNTPEPAGERERGGDAGGAAAEGLSR